jgi:tetratricopeptide (TPR) repeat protein
MLVLSCLFWTGCEPQGPKALLEGERVLKQERYNEAIALFQLATEKIPREARAWNLLGLAYQGAGLSSEAAQAYSKALALDHKLSAAHYNLGCLYLEQDQTQLAVTELTAFTLLQPRAVEGWLRLASAQTRVNRLDAAEVCYRNALTLVPKHPEALNGMGYVSVSRRRYIEAIQYFQIALAESPNYGPALLNQAVVTHRHLNQRVTALQKYRAYLALQPRPDNWEAVNQVAQNLADELAGSNRAPAATALTNTVYRTNPAPTAASLANNTARTVVTQSLTAVQPPVVVPPSRPAAGQPATATPTPTPPAAIRPTVALPPQPAPPPASVPSTAAVVLSPVRETVPPPPEVVISEVGREMNIKPAADPVLPPPQPGSRPATTIASGSPAAAAAPSVAPQRTAPPPVAANEDRPGFFQRLNPFRSRPKNDPPLPASVRADPPRSATPANAAREISATQVQATLADALPTEGFPRYAYRQAVRPNAGDRQKAAELVNKGILAHRDRRAEEEVNFYRSATLVDPSNYDAFFNLGLASAEQGDWTTALHAYEQALNIDPDSVNGRYNFAAALRQSNYPIDAARELEAILQTRPDDGKTLLALGNLYAQKFKQNRTARYYYLRMLEAEPNHPKAAEVRFWLTSNP